ncbi:MAG: hypothetical protein Q9187_003641 [Circinaria calcarea]
MTAVASPPSFEPLPRLGWNTGNGAPGGLNSMSADDVTRIFMSRKGPQRSNSSSSISSTTSSSSNTTVSSTSPLTNGGPPPTTNGHPEGWIHRKKPARGLWPSSKAEPVSGITDARPQPMPTPPSGPSAASAMSAIHQPSPILPSQNMNPAVQQQNGTRPAATSGPPEPQAVLVLLPVNGTFERKQITVPFLPEMLRIGRQTNAKTVPTPVNGYFDSKVLSRQHAEVWADRNGKIWIRDVKSSNGTFVNGTRLSPENRDSEPHALREHDMLELGIDIVSEDQKSIVHHKVSARVEHAGLVNNGTNVMDLNFGDIDPASGGGIMGPPFPQHLPQNRSRGGSLGSIVSNARMIGHNGIAGTNGNGLVAQRQMNSWLSPVSIEQVVRKLAAELKQAKQQSQDLNRTGDFFGILLTEESGKNPPISTSELPPHEAQMNGIPHQSKMDPMSPFSQPPAPPPQQPLPEKPDVSRFTGAESIDMLSLKKAGAERPRSGENILPTKLEASSSQILSLVEALTSAKREIDSQGDRVKHLEDLLYKERKARESAEERTRRLLEARSRGVGDDEAYSVEEEAFNPPTESVAQESQTQPNGYEVDDEGHTRDSKVPISNSLPSSPDESMQNMQRDTTEADVSTSRLQERLESMVREMDEMKVQMEKYRRRAEGAEDEKRGLLDMVERIRMGEADASVVKVSNSRQKSTEMATQTEENPSTPVENGDPSPKSSTSEAKEPSYQNGKAIEPIDNLHDLHKAVTTALVHSESRNGLLTESAPYASMLGVVLIGVGIMTYLNSWQKVERL